MGSPSFAGKITPAEEARVGLLKEIHAKMSQSYFKPISIDEQALLYVYNTQIKVMRILDPSDSKFQSQTDAMTYWNATWLVQMLRDPSDKFSFFIPRPKVLLTNPTAQNGSATGNIFLTPVAPEKISIASRLFLVEDIKIGYIKISQFDGATGKEFIEEFNKLQQDEVEGLVIDLRGNGGGDVEAIPPILSLFIDGEKEIVFFKKRDVGRQQYSTDESPASFTKPMTILINERTASASEIFAGALQHYRKATLVGTDTEGVGLLKNLISLSDGSQLRLVTSLSYLPNGESFHQKGIKPEIRAKDANKQLTKAVEHILDLI